MIIKNICVLIEAMSIIFCLHQLYGEKFILDKDTVCLLAVDMIMMQAIEYFKWSSIWSILIYPIIILYCGKKFGFHIKDICINLGLCVVLIAIVQLIVTFIFCYWFGIRLLSDINYLLASCIVLLMILIIFPICKVRKLAVYLKKQERLILTAIGFCIVTMLFWIIIYKELKWLEAYQAIILFICITFILILSGQLGKYKVRAKEIETELRMHKLYASTFEGLIENIRMRQHEFDNHITTIYSLHYTNNSYEELVKAQEEYCQLLLKENHFNKLLAKGNPVIIGFLYGKFLEIEKKGIEITYSINFDEFNINVPIYRIVEVLGNLLDNAIEALDKEKEGKKIYIAIEEESKDFSIVIRNKSTFIDYNEISDFFTKGYSKKGSSRGLGLYNVKKICEEYGMSICCENEEINNENWLCFKINKAI